MTIVDPEKENDIDTAIQIMEGSSRRFSDTVQLVMQSLPTDEENAIKLARDAVFSVLIRTPSNLSDLQHAEISPAGMHRMIADQLADNGHIKKNDVEDLVGGVFKATQGTMQYLHNRPTQFAILTDKVPDALAQKMETNKSGVVKEAVAAVIRTQGPQRISQLWEKDAGKVIKQFGAEIDRIRAANDIPAPSGGMSRAGDKKDDKKPD